jgi:hypothetical protein
MRGLCLVLPVSCVLTVCAAQSPLATKVVLTTSVLCGPLCDCLRNCNSTCCLWVGALSCSIDNDGKVGAELAQGAQTPLVWPFSTVPQRARRRVLCFCALEQFWECDHAGCLRSVHVSATPSSVRQSNYNWPGPWCLGPLEGQILSCF